MIASTVKVFDFFPEITERVDALAKSALTDAAEVAAQTAAQIGADRNATDIRVIPAHGDISGWTSGINGRHHYRWQSFGTLSHAIRPKRPGSKRDRTPPKGITPNLMYLKARTAGRRVLRARISGGL